jgi:hypothetical protein
MVYARNDQSEDRLRQPTLKPYDLLCASDAGRADVEALAREGRQIFTFALQGMAAILTLHTGKTLMRVTTIHVTIDHLLNIRPPESILPGELFIIALHKGFKIILYAMVVIRILWMAGPVNGGWHCQMLTDRS